MENQKESLKVEINSLKIKYENEKGLSEKQKGLLESLLWTQEQIIRLEGNLSTVISPRKEKFKKAKTSLRAKLSEEEVEKLCQLQIELTKIEMELEKKLGTEIEVLLK